MATSLSPMAIALHMARQRHRYGIGVYPEACGDAGLVMDLRAGDYFVFQCACGWVNRVSGKAVAVVRVGGNDLWFANRPSRYDSLAHRLCKLVGVPYDDR
jgi:hypothetical protein